MVETPAQTRGAELAGWGSGAPPTVLGNRAPCQLWEGQRSAVEFKLLDRGAHKEAMGAGRRHAQISRCVQRQQSLETDHPGLQMIQEEGIHFNSK